METNPTSVINSEDFVKDNVGRYVFAKGNKIARGRKEGTTTKKTEILKSLGFGEWKELITWVENRGVTRFIGEMEALEGKDYIIAYLGILPYVKGKKANVESNPDDTPIQINVFGKQVQATRKNGKPVVINNTTNNVTIINEGIDSNEVISNVPRETIENNNEFTDYEDSSPLD